MEKPEKIDRILKLEAGCCLEACENGWIKAVKSADGFLVDISDAKQRWCSKAA